MAGVAVDAFQIQGIKRESAARRFWLFDGRNTGEEVDELARRCRTVSPNMVKDQLQLSRRPQ